MSYQPLASCGRLICLIGERSCLSAATASIVMMLFEGEVVGSTGVCFQTLQADVETPNQFDAQDFALDQSVNCVFEAGIK